MSTENISKFAAATAASPELQAKVQVIQVDAAQATAEKIAALSVEAGTPFTAEEFLASATSQTHEISDEQLENVAGGIWRPDDGNVMFSLMTLGIGCGLVASASVMVTGQKDSKNCQPSDWGRK